MTTLTERGTLELYEKTGALLRGHFRLTSGLHSDVYLQSALVLQHPVHAAALGAALAAPFRNDGIQTVLAPAIGGILVAHEVGRALGVRALFTEREDGVMPAPWVHTGSWRALPGGGRRDDHGRLDPRGRDLRRGARGDRGGSRLPDRSERRKHEFLREACHARDGEGDDLEAGRVSAVQSGRPGDQARQPRLKPVRATSCPSRARRP